MSSIYGQNIRLSVFGQSHSAAIGMTLDGIPAGIQIDREKLQLFLNRRSPGRTAWSTTRKEEDVPEFLCGLKDDVTCGAPLTAIIRNHDTRSSDYTELSVLPRPGHADYTANLRYCGYQDAAGGGHFSGRLTASICVAGGILLQELYRKGIEIRARIVSIANIRDTSDFDCSVADKPFPVVDDKCAVNMQELICDAKERGDSVGGVVECIIDGMPGGIGDPMFDCVESRLAQILFSIPAVKGVEFGNGFTAAELYGSENNDAFYVTDSGQIRTRTNHSGGILGGITDGMPIVFRLAFKPTPSISIPQRTVNLQSLKEETLSVKGRHDPCIVPRAVPVVEAAAALAAYDLYIGRNMT